MKVYTKGQEMNEIWHGLPLGVPHDAGFSA
jgi:hypothetical protein